MIVRIGLNVVYVNSLAFEQGSADDRSSVRFEGDSPQRFLVFEILPGSAAGSHAIGTLFWQPDVRNLRFAQPRRKGIEYRLQIEWRAADDLQYLGRGSLLLQRVVKLPGERDLCFLAHTGGTAAAHGLLRIAALQRYPLTASRFYWFVACFGAPPHGLSPAWDRAFLD